MPKTVSRKTPWCLHLPLTASEWLARRIYWSTPAARALLKWYRVRRERTPQIAKREEFKQYLRRIGVDQGSLVMVHSSMTGVTFLEESAEEPHRANVLLTARQFIADVIELIGKTGTVVMPAHPVYQSENEYEWPDPSAPPVRYDPATTPCNVGLANELFWRWPGALRSFHPVNSLAAYGAAATELFENNLNDDKPLPHGIYSGYYRFCQKNGLLISVGVPLVRYMTVVLVAEEIRDQAWPIADFWGERRYAVRVAGEYRDFVVREHRPEFSKFCHCMQMVRRDLVGEGIVHEGAVGSLRVDWAYSREVYDYMMSRNRHSPYPYCGSRLVRIAE